MARRDRFPAAVPRSKFIRTIVVSLLKLFVDLIKQNMKVLKGFNVYAILIPDDYVCTEHPIRRFSLLMKERPFSA